MIFNSNGEVMMSSSKTDLLNFDIADFKTTALAKLKAGQSLTGKDGILTPLIKHLVEASLEGELEFHLKECQAEGSSNRRNGKMTKKMQSDSGAFELETPRDREGSFEPEIVKKRQTVLNESLDNKVLALYALGMSYEAIGEHLAVRGVLSQNQPDYGQAASDHYRVEKSVFRFGLSHRFFGCNALQGSGRRKSHEPSVLYGVGHYPRREKRHPGDVLI